MRALLYETARGTEPCQTPITEMGDGRRATVRQTPKMATHGTLRCHNRFTPCERVNMNLTQSMPLSLLPLCDRKGSRILLMHFTLLPRGRGEGSASRTTGFKQACVTEDLEITSTHRHCVCGYEKNDDSQKIITDAFPRSSSHQRRQTNGEYFVLSLSFAIRSDPFSTEERVMVRSPRQIVAIYLCAPPSRPQAQRACTMQECSRKEPHQTSRILPNPDRTASTPILSPQYSVRVSRSVVPLISTSGRLIFP